MLAPTGTEREKGTEMAERRSNYTGSEHEELIRRTMEAGEKKTKCRLTPMMVLSDVARTASGLVEEGAPTQFMQNSSRLILRVLAHNGGICQLDLARETGLKPPTISVALSKMEKEKLVTRIIDGMDGRATRVYLTDTGTAINDQIFERIRDIDDAAVEGFSEEEKEMLMGMLSRMRENLRKKAENR